MIRGFMKTSSRTALLAAAGLLMGSYAFGPAKAADLGASCCGDLEERVAELEATTARKGNRVVSLQVYGQVNKAFLNWDDGDESDTFVVDNDNSGSRLGFTGKATMMPGWTAGYLLEFDFQDSASDKVTNTGFKSATAGVDADELNNNEIVIRYNEGYIEHERYGRFSLGQGSSAADGINEIVLGNSLRNSDLQWNNSFRLRLADGTLANFNWAQTAGNLDGGRDDRIRWDSPSLYGFILSASWGDNDYWDTALRFKKEWNSIRIAAGIGYQWDGTEDSSPIPGPYRAGETIAGTLLTGNNAGSTSSYLDAFSSFEVISGSLSMQHIPTGLYFAFAAGEKDYDEFDNDPSFWYLQLGVERKWLPYGSTTIYGEYSQYNDFNRALLTINAGATATTVGANLDSEVERWGFGIVQKFDSAAMEIYGQAVFWSYEDNTAVAYEDLTQFMVGSRIKF